MEFEWNAAKDAVNKRKHGIGFREAAEDISWLRFDE
jgi:uncharacterized DUF497 family protein